MARSQLLLGVSLAIVLLTTPARSSAQITGIVFDSDGAILSNVRITLLRDTTQVAERRSDESGWFAFSREESMGAVGVRAQLVGYQSVIFRLSEPEQHVEFRLQPSTLSQQRDWRIQIASAITVSAIRVGEFSVQVPDGVGTITFPKTIEPGDPLVLELASHGSSSCTRPDRVVKTSDNDYVTIVVLDRVRFGECSADWAAFPREVTHSFDTVGKKVIRIVGIRDDRVIHVTVERWASGQY